ncbi:hypothetical protein GPJ56_002066 [Histomonas meleagridis]|uniref:uncharacterized protein n=1 Tax=Histomonas meleagridis TaxID=135588 RepID=UPI003559E783|nr:hypothetical protein GPJ56_002066 [Histomonas meleagridis]KAH0800865.1 hypothetical protein GO595_006316 [Histomonas meleagridis]
MSPIEVLAYEKYSQSTFILLRNYNWFIFKLPELIKTGSLFAPIFSSPHRSLLPRESDLTEPPAASTPVATAIIRFNESRILYAVHPHYIALRVQQSCIHVIPIEGNNEPFIIPILQSNIVDMAFLGPVSCSTRLSFISDSQTGDRLLSVYSLNDTSTEFSLEFTVNLPNNAHSLLPLHPELHSSIVVFTRDGVIRITAPEGLSQTVEHLSAFMPPYIVHHCHFFDDIYLICDSCGGLSGVSLPVEGTVTIESMKNVGPTSGIIAINKQHFFVASPFGDSSIYYYEFNENDGKLYEKGSFQLSSKVLSLIEFDNKIFYSTEGGGIGQLTECDDVLLMKVRDALDEENVVMLADTITPAMFEWKQENIFIDLDNLEVILKLPKRLINKIAQKVGMNRDELVNHLQKYL